MTSQKRINCIMALAFMVLISSSFAATSSSQWELYLKTKKYLYVWGYPNTENFLQFVKDHNFSRVYLYIGCVQWDVDNLVNGNFYSAGDSDSKTLVQKLLDMGVEVEPTMYLNDGPNNFANVDKVEDVAKAMAELQKTLKFKALHFDVEPSSSGNYEALLKMYETARQYLKVSAILKPGWLSQKMSDIEKKFTSSEYYAKFKDCETFVDALMMVTDYSDLMAYSNTYEGINKFLDKYEVIRKRHPEHEAKPVIELDPSITNDGIYAKYKEDPDTFFSFLSQVSQQFDGITIHQYEVWAKDLYCEKVKKDTTYYFGEPKEC